MSFVLKIVLSTHIKLIPLGKISNLIAVKSKPCQAAINHPFGAPSFVLHLAQSPFLFTSVDRR